MRIAALIIALLMGAWLSFDGTRALVKGDYVTRNGELGPWSRIVAAAGIDPRGTTVKVAHVVLGIAWLIAAILWIGNASIGRIVLIGCSVASLWYLPLGTLLSIVEIALLFLPALRK
jgi:hypothetical protein